MSPLNNLPKIRLHGLANYDRSAKPRWLLTELGVPFEMRWLDGEKREFESPEFLKLNPMGRVPVLEIDDTVIFESDAILEYLADRLNGHQGKSLAPAYDSRERAQYLQWMHFATAAIQLQQNRIQIVEDIPPGELFETKQSAVQSDLRDGCVAIDRALEKNRFLLPHFSAADMSVSYHLYWMTLWPELKCVLREFPRVIEYLERMKKMPSAIQADVFSYQG